MKHPATALLAICLTLCLSALNFASPVLAAAVRPPVAAGRFYPAHPAQLRKAIDYLTRLAQKTRVPPPAGKKLKALILPHAGYQYSGWTAAHAAPVLAGRRFSKVVLLGPDHYIGFRNGAITAAGAYQTPLGIVRLHPDTQKLRRMSALFQTLPVARDQEHSLEVVLPFLQRYLHKFELVPVIVGPTDIEKFAAAVDAILDDDTLLVVSSDLSHYLPYDAAVARDQRTLKMIVNLQPAALSKTPNRACGIFSIQVLLTIARRHHWQPLILHYSNSGDTTGDKSRVVGYAAVAFFGETPMQKDNHKNLTAEQGQILLELARCTLMEKLGRPVTQSRRQALEKSLQQPCFQRHCGTFVTLKLDGQLRGCIGNLSSAESIQEGVTRNAVNAAFHDPRFAPLSPAELDRVQIEVSVLTAPQPLEYTASADLLRKLRVNVDGVIIRKGYASATFLPQVWEQLPRPEDFLTHLCLKAGLSPDAWRNAKLEVSTYQVQYFEESR